MAESHEAGGDAGTRFPFINLEKAIGRAKQLFDADQKGREMGHAAAFHVWGYSTKSSGGFQTVAALKMYGLISAPSSGKVALTKGALRYFRDEREEEKAKLLRGFALTPKLIASLWKDWRATPPADPVARSHLKAERGLSDQASRSLLAIYKENLALANLKGDDKIPVVSEDDLGDEGNNLPPVITVKVGDYVQWTSNGAHQFKIPRRVVWVSEDGQFLRVQGSPTGIPMTEVAVTAPSSPPPMAPAVKSAGNIAYENAQSGKPDINVYVTGNRIQITADVDREGIKTLKQMLGKYEEILTLLSTPIDGSMATGYTNDEQGHEAEKRDQDRDESLR